MNILVINGSPKGDYSCTLQTALYLEMRFPEQTFRYLNAASQIRALEKDPSPALEMLREADLLLFAYPVYTFIVPSQLHRFIELIKGSGIDISGKYTSQITTSKHFYDMTAHRFVEENCLDMGLKVIKGLSADMDDLLSDRGQNDAESFFRYLMWCAENDAHEPGRAALPAPAHRPVTVPATSSEEKSGNIVIVADLAEDDTQLRDMIARFMTISPLASRVVNIHDFPFRGGCLSCFNCAAGGDCVYKDGFQELLRNDIQKSDAIVIAFSIKDHSMGSRFKTYDDRQFCNGHRTVTMGKPFAYIVSGDLKREDNLRLIIDGRAEVGGNFLAGVATDEEDPDRELDTVAKRLAYAVRSRHVQPPDFLGVGGIKIFRDLIWLMQGLMKEDHRFYRSHGMYDFPQKQRGRMLKMYLVGALFANKDIRKKMGNKMNEGMVAPYKKVLDRLDKQGKREDGQ